jgi:uncharacterized protein YbjQ (UPF0145 family)
VTDGGTTEELAERSAKEIAAGRLPLRAQWRIAEQRARRDAGDPGSFTSALTVDEFTAIRSVGFTPVGQVMGSAVYDVGWQYPGCGYLVPEYGREYQGSWDRPPQYAPVTPAPATQALLGQARTRAMQRMTEECAGLGGDGVVGVRLAVAPFYDDSLEFTAIGTAVRADGPVRPRVPFTSDLSGQDFAKLLAAGWLPVALVQGVGAVVRHNDTGQAAQQAGYWNQEIDGRTALVHAARDAARDSLAQDAYFNGGHTVILRDLSLSVTERLCPSAKEGEDYLASAYLWGTALVPLVGRPDRSAAPLQMMKLNARKGPLT